jgi:hypothetical protein
MHFKQPFMGVKWVRILGQYQPTGLFRRSSMDKNEVPYPEYLIGKMNMLELASKLVKGTLDQGSMMAER